MMAIAMPLFPATTSERELDRETLARCVAHDAAAFRAFVVRYQRPVFACLSRMTGRGPHLEDLAQETFLRAYRAFPSFDLENTTRPSTWLLTIAMRLALDARKSKASVANADLELDVGPASSADPERELARSELGHALERAASTLTDDQRAAFVLFELHGLSMLDVATALQIPEATVKTRLFRARERMRQALASHRDGKEDRDG